MRDTRGKKAFTTMELLVAVAVVVVLLAVSMPLVSKLVSGLKMRELDGYAKSIYLEAQDQLIAMRAEGSLADFATQVQDSGRKVTQMPADFESGEEDDDSWQNLYYLNTADALMEKIIPADASFDGKYLIEFNPDSGAVYGVFYWEKDAEIDYSKDILTLASRESADRTAFEIGYYGGSLDDTAQESFDLDQQVNIVNGEELYVEISYAHSTMLRKNYTKQGVFTVTLDLKGSGGESYSLPLQGENISMTRKSDRLYLYVLLDSMIPAHSFKEITGGNLTPGDDVTVTVMTTFKKGSIAKTQTSTAATVNSLFASKTGGEIHISALRHLRNLDNYTNVSADNITAIVLDSDIDFDAGEYMWKAENGVSKYTGKADRPIDTFTPLKNDELFQSSAGVALRGNNHVLKNFVIQDTENYVGIIGKISHMTISGVLVQDIQVQAAGSEYVGGFAGSIKNSTVSGSGVCLSTKDENGDYYSQNLIDTGDYSDEMEERYHTYTVSGKNQVGGFCGVASNVQFSESFGAVMVSGSAMVGGFCGNAENGTTFTSCYSSGEVTANQWVGGFAGKISGATFTNCYTTGEVTADAKESTAGGFVGKSENSTYKKCISYAKLSGTNGENNTDGGFGVFLGQSNTSGDTFTKCVYLNQYNKGFNEANNIKGKKYTELKADTPNSAEQSFPYSATLTGSAFPFPMVTSSHYGNWQGQYVIDTSLVYFERYENDKYGYYCVTTAKELGSDESTDTDDDQEEATGSEITWVLDTLQDEICIEDGYALLTLYNLASFDYLQDIASAGTNSQKKTLTIADKGDYGEDKATKLTQQGTLKFKGYDGSFSADADFSEKTVSDTFSVSGMYLYQLPYGLQTADRENVSNFYDKLTIYNGIAQNGSVVIGEDDADKGLVFYYCPHFAKTAVNPQITKNEEDETKNTLQNPSYVSVRSAKQLNALGRYTYYWNNRKGMDQTLYFKQEADISFSKYVKEYCGKTFDLMDTKNEDLRNQPIGQPKSDNTSGQFNNNYDGNGYCIIDYCLESSNQFVGFFGEVEKGTIKNIILTVSKPGNGYIRGSYDGKKSTAVGGIVGLSYNNENTIQNCSISGYTVEYISSTSPKIYSINVGGLVGASMSKLTNCAATCDVSAMVNGEYTYAISLGGLAGTAYYDTISNSYAGGTIKVQVEKDTYIKSLGGLAAGGIAGAALQIYSNMSSNLKLSTTYENLYSYTQILIDKKFKDVQKYYISPIVAKEVLGTHSSQEVGPTLLASNITIKNCYYLDEEILQAQTEKTLCEYTDEKRYGAASVDYDGLQKLTFTNMGKVASSTYTFPISSKLTNRRYPFPAAVKDAQGYYVHYGDWPLDPNAQTYSESYPAYYELYEDTTVGICYVDYNGAVMSKLDDTKKITATGYATIERKRTSGTVLAEVTIEDAEGSYFIYEDSKNKVENTDNAICIPFDGKDENFNFTVVTIDATSGVTNRQTISMPVYMNPKFGASISTSSALGTTESEPLQVRTAEQFQHVSDIACKENSPAVVKQTRTVDLTDIGSSVKVKEGCTYDGGMSDNWQLTNAAMAIFEKNNGTIFDVWVKDSKQAFIETNAGSIKNCLVEDARIISDSDAAVFVVKNEGEIQDCSVKNAKLTAEEDTAAGFAYMNSGTITGCTVQESQLNAKNSAGFIGTNEGTLKNCGAYSETAYSKLSVTGTAQAAGFALTNHGTITTCYAAGEVKAPTAAGFLLVNKTTGSTTATVKTSYASCKTTADETAYGFIAENAATIQSCYSAGTVSAADSIYGFGKNSDSKAELENCYSVCELKGNAKNVYGFGTADSTGSVENCYWGYSKAVNKGIAEQGIGTRVTFKKLAKLTISGLSVRSNITDVPYTASLGTNYPYPAVSTLVHYGDWPLAKGVIERNSTINEGNYIGLFYYEQYEDGVYGIYAVGLDATSPTTSSWWSASLNNFESDPIINTLDAADEAVTESGWGIFYYNGLTTSNWAYKYTITNTGGGPGGGPGGGGQQTTYTTVDTITNSFNTENTAYTDYTFKVVETSSTANYTQNLYYSYRYGSRTMWLDKSYSLTSSTITDARPTEQ